MIKIILIIEFSYTPKASFVFTSIALKRELLFPLGTKVPFLHCLQFIRSNEPSPYLTSPKISDSFNGCPQNVQPSISLFTTYPSSITRLPVNHYICLSFLLLSSTFMRISLSTSSPSEHNHAHADSVVHAILHPLPLHLLQRALVG